MTGRERFARALAERAEAEAARRLIRRQRIYLLISAGLGTVTLGLWVAAAMGWWKP